MADPSETTQVSESHADVETRELLDAVRSLAAQVGSLQADLQALRAEGRVLPVGHGDTHGWDERPVARQESPPWVRSLDGPGVRRPAVPRLALEIVFLVAVALVAALARLHPVAIVALMLASWALVAGLEWLAWREAAKREAALVRTGLAASALADDAAWFAPPSVARAARSDETAARLPPSQDD